MYRVSPFTYLISSLLSTGVANTEVNCSQIELLTFKPPSGMTCGDYMTPYIQMAGGAVSNPQATEACQFCTLADTNVFLQSVVSDFGERWRNLGIVWAYIAFNVIATCLLYWLARVPKSWSIRSVFQLLTKGRRVSNMQ